MTIISDAGIHGILLSTDTGVSIPPDDDTYFWSLSDQDKIASLNEARDKCKLLSQYQDFLWLQRHSLRDIIGILNDDQHYMDLLLGISENQFANDADKSEAEFILAEIQRITSGVPLKRATKLSTRAKIIARDKSTCRYCGVKVSGQRLHIDHVIPYSLGGRTEIDNLVVSCSGCNLKKSGKTLDECGMSLKEVLP